MQGDLSQRAASRHILPGNQHAGSLLMAPPAACCGSEKKEPSAPTIELIVHKADQHAAMR
jgi:hypothetical protein